ncbi:MAG: rod shape-determining protein MreD [Candidatus Aminicenantes bacterium]|nr:rod shape-determining protein MreD [Candidatus Aminicenantes bacterium]
MRIRSGIGAGIGIITAVVIHTFLEKISISANEYISLLSLVVILYAVKKGELFGAGLGTVCGLIQDSFSAGIYGISGLAKTLTGFLAGYISRKININSPFRSFILIFVLVVMEILIWSFFYWFITKGSFFRGGTGVFFRPLLTSILGSFLFMILKKYKFFIVP